jgi:hypothetical protein
MFRIVDVAVFTRGVFMENWFFRKLIALWEVWEGFSLPEHLMMMMKVMMKIVLRSLGNLIFQVLFVFIYLPTGL